MLFFFFKDTATTEIYTYLHTLSLHDALPFWLQLFDGASHGAEGQVAPAFRSNGDTLAGAGEAIERAWQEVAAEAEADGAGSDGDTGILGPGPAPDRKSTRLNSSH